jgi:predicted nucleotide-binding protein
MPQPKKPAENVTEFKGPRAEFPKNALERAMAFPEALQKNGGQPLDAIDMATAVGLSPGSSTFRTLAASSSAYGLTGGSYKSAFSMADAGRAIVEPMSPDERAEALVTAAMRPGTYRSIFDYYKGKRFPDRQFFVNTIIREFNVDPKQAEACVDVFTANMRYVGLIKDTPGGDWLAKEASATTVTAAQVDAAEATAAEQEATEHGDEVQGDVPGAGPTPPTPPIESQKRRRPNRIFIGHGRNHTPLDQLTKTLTNLGIPYAVAEEEATVGRPISQKVRDTMEQCGAAILIFSADVEYFDKEGNSVWRPSENVSHELGAASIMYDDRIIMFKEEDVTLASNYSGIGYIPFEKDALDAKVNDLLKELLAMKMLKVSVGDDDD